MDPATAFSLAGTILQFLDTGTRFTGLALTIYRDGRGHEDEVLQSLTDDLDESVKGLQSPQGATTAGQDDSLVRLAQECQKVANRLLHFFREHQLPENPRKRDALKAAFTRMWGDDKVKALVAELEKFRSQLNFHLLVLLREHAMESAQQQESTLQKLGFIQESNNKIEGIASSILAFIASKSNFSHSRSRSIEAAQIQLQQNLLETLYEASEDNLNPQASLIAIPNRRREELQRRMLANLYYDKMADREESIKDAFKSTFQWIFDEHNSPEREWSIFSHWLESDDQLYWITGKAGSGKSTLMKFICDHRASSDSSQPSSPTFVLGGNTRCHNYLEKGAGGLQVIVASFYFWSSDTELQMTQTGLLRSLLHQILTQCPDVIPDVAPIWWEAMCLFDENIIWKLTDLQHMMRKAAKSLASRSRVCLFVDGLDEFGGKPEVLINFFSDLLADNKHIKACVASRPWVEFESAFDRKPSLRLEDFTDDDIKLYVSSNLGEDQYFVELQQLDRSSAEDLIDNVVSKASGVFLWVYLVISSLLAGWKFGDRIKDLQERLELLPVDLEKLYEKMLRSIDDPTYRMEAAQYFKIMGAAVEPLSILTLSFADEATTDSVLEMRFDVLSRERVTLMLNTMSRRLNSRSKGLLEVERRFRDNRVDVMFRATLTVQYLHRTVKDFVETSQVQLLLQSFLEPDFDPHLHLCIACLASAKSFDSKSAIEQTVRRCFYNASCVLPRNEKDMIRVLDDLAGTLQMEQDSSRQHAFRISRTLGASDSDSLYDPFFVPMPYINQQWAFESQYGDFGQTFLSLATIHGVVSYVRARGERKCLVQKPYKNGRTLIWPLLMDAVSVHPPSLAMIQCLFDLNADPNHDCGRAGGETPWMRAVSQAKSTGLNAGGKRGLILKEIQEDWKKVLELMILNGADVTRAGLEMGHGEQEPYKYVLWQGYYESLQTAARKKAGIFRFWQYLSLS